MFKESSYFERACSGVSVVVRNFHFVYLSDSLHPQKRQSKKTSAPGPSQGPDVPIASNLSLHVILNRENDDCRAILASMKGRFSASTYQAVSWRDPHTHKTLLMCAARLGEADMVSQMLATGTLHVDQSDMNGKTALCHAAEGGHVDILRMLVDAGAAVDSTAPSGTSYTVLMTAAMCGNRTAALFLLDKGANVNAYDPESGDTVLHCAIAALDCRELPAELEEGGFDPVVRKLLELGANASRVTKAGRTPLMRASRVLRGSLCIPDLIAAGVFLNFRIPDGEGPRLTGGTALHVAAACGRPHAIRLLIEAGANIEVVDASHHTPLLTAAESGNRVCVEILLRAGANIEAKSRKGATPLMTAVVHRQWKVVHLLLEEGADLTVEVNGLSLSTMDLSTDFSMPRAIHQRIRELAEQGRPGSPT